VISSPPYWGLRDYGVEGQWGSEDTFHEFLDTMMSLMTEIKRILKPTGTCWINLGDSYSTQSGGMRDLAEGKEEQHGTIKYTDKNGAYDVKQKKTNLKPKTRIGIPERFMIRCIDDGWLLRNHIPWVKSNAMPTSVKDRFQNKWESIFFFAKKGKYYFDLDAVREKPLSEGYRPSNKKNSQLKSGLQVGLFGDIKQEEEAERGNFQPEGRSHFGTGNDIRKNMEKARKQAEVPGQTTQGIHRNRMEGKPDWAYNDIGTQGQGKSLKERMAYARKVEGKEHDNCLSDPKGKNPGDVFFINPKPFVEAHFATFPEELPDKIIKCAVPERVCKKCGVPVENIMEPTPEYAEALGKSWHDHSKDQEQGMQQKMQKESITASYQKVGEKTCDCNAGFEPGTVFDPFMGAGTVALVALKNHRRWLGVELNPEYVEIIRKRLEPMKNNSLDQFS
jgi:DNA modification methylase